MPGVDIIQVKELIGVGTGPPRRSTTSGDEVSKREHRTTFRSQDALLERTMRSVAKADIEHQHLAYLVHDEPLHDRPVSEVHRVVVACANAIADALGVEDRDDAEDLERMIQFMRSCIKVRECDRRSLATTLDAIVGGGYVEALPGAERERLSQRVAVALQEVAKI
jgi:hypothetical protein